MEIRVDGTLGFGVSPKDLILHHRPDRHRRRHRPCHRISRRGAFAAMSIEGRLTVANMSIEAGARSGLFAPDEKTFAYLKGRPMAPKGEAWEKALAWWRTLASDAGAASTASSGSTRRDRAERDLGHQPGGRRADHRRVPDPDSFADPEKRAAARKSLDYMGLTPGTRLRTSPVEHVFIGSCTNSRIEDLRAAAEVCAAARCGGVRRPWSCRAPAWSSARPSRRGSTASSSRPASNGASPAARCAWR
jgi:3-isopropylmalate/(R)-2-methylmalate dehydratase large subunit